MVISARHCRTGSIRSRMWRGSKPCRSASSSSKQLALVVCHAWRIDCPFPWLLGWVSRRMRWSTSASSSISLPEPSVEPSSTTNISPRQSTWRKTDRTFRTVRASLYTGKIASMDESTVAGFIDAGSPFTWLHCIQDMIRFFCFLPLTIHYNPLAHLRLLASFGRRCSVSNWYNSLRKARVVRRWKCLH